MAQQIRRGLVLVCAVGGASSAWGAVEDRLPQLAGRTAPGVPVGHIYYNLATGERVITPYEQRPRSTSQALWLNNNADPCGTGMNVGIIDDPDLDGDGLGDFAGEPCVGGTFPCEGSWTLFWGDIEYDSVIDCVVVAYGINAPDLDLDSDSMGDGIVGYDMHLTFSDNDNGFGQDLIGLCGRSCILDLAIPSLSGAVVALPQCTLAIYTLTLDLAGTAPSMVFELGDLNGVDDTPGATGNSGGALYGPNSINPSTGFPYPFPSAGIDWDSNGLADVSYAFRFDQSTLGVAGAPGLTQGANGFVTTARKLGNIGDLPPDPADANGLFDARDVYSTGPQCGGLQVGNPAYIGTFFYGGFTCAPGAEIPSSSAYLELYGPGANLVCNEADLAPRFGELDFSDVLAFLGAFVQGIPGGEAADLDEPFGVLDFSDVTTFLIAFGAGCP